MAEEEIVKELKRLMPAFKAAFESGYRAGADDTHEGRYDPVYRWAEFERELLLGPTQT